MKTFEELYTELHSVNNSELNNAWQEAKKESEKAKKLSLKICLTIDAIFILVLLILFFIAGSTSFFFLLQPLLIVFVINIFVFVIVNVIFSKKQNEFNTKYKNIVISGLINNFYDNVEYYPNKEMPEYIYRNLNYEHYDKYSSDDYFEAQINNKYSIQMAEIHTQEEETYKDSDGNTRTRTYTRFHGLFAKIIMDKSINSELKIMQNGNLLFDKKLKMDSSEFEKYFDVKASNSIIGMQLLTSDVMEELVHFENKTNMKFDICIKENEIYLRFHSGNMFEVRNVKNGAVDKETLHKYFYMLNLTYNLSNKLINTINETNI